MSLLPAHWASDTAYGVRISHNSVQPIAEAFLTAEGFTEVAIGLWRHDDGDTASVTPAGPLMPGFVHVQFNPKGAA